MLQTVQNGRHSKKIFFRTFIGTFKTFTFYIMVKAALFLAHQDKDASSLFTVVLYDQMAIKQMKNVFWLSSLAVYIKNLFEAFTANNFVMYSILSLTEASCSRPQSIFSVQQHNTLASFTETVLVNSESYVFYRMLLQNKKVFRMYLHFQWGRFIIEFILKYWLSIITSSRKLAMFP